MKQIELPAIEGVPAHRDGLQNVRHRREGDQRSRAHSGRSGTEAHCDRDSCRRIIAAYLEGLLLCRRHFGSVYAVAARAFRGKQATVGARQ